MIRNVSIRNSLGLQGEIKDRDKLLKVASENDKCHTRELPSSYQLISQHKLYNPEGNDMTLTYLK